MNEWKIQRNKYMTSMWLDRLKRMLQARDMIHGDSMNNSEHGKSKYCKKIVCTWDNQTKIEVTHIVQHQACSCFRTPLYIQWTDPWFACTNSHIGNSVLTGPIRTRFSSSGGKTKSCMRQGKNTTGCCCSGRERKEVEHGSWVAPWSENGALGDLTWLTNSAHPYLEERAGQ